MVKNTYMWLNTYSKKKYYSWNWKFSKDLHRVSASYQTCLQQLYYPTLDFMSVDIVGIVPKYISWQNQRDTVI